MSNKAAAEAAADKQGALTGGFLGECFSVHGTVTRATLACVMLVGMTPWFILDGGGRAHAQSPSGPAFSGPAVPASSGGPARQKPRLRAGSRLLPNFEQTRAVSKILVDGTQRVEPETVHAYMVLKVGDLYDATRLNQSIKELFATGLFSDVTITQVPGTAEEGVILRVQVVENPVINRVAIEGNRRIEDDLLLQELSLQPRLVFSRSRVQGDVERIQTIYRREGRFGATVDPKVIQLEKNRVDLVFEVDEGPRTNVRRISFVGNRDYADGELLEVVETRESAWYRFLTASDTYDPDRIAYDKELLRRFYLSEGYADFRVLSAIAELAPDGEAFLVTFTLSEGPRYRIGAVDILSRLRKVEPEELRPLVTIEQESWFNADEVEDTIHLLTDALGTRGYAFVDVREKLERDRDQQVVDITFEINEAEKVFVDRIEISGNVRTLDEVIRREMLLAEGDAFNAARLRRSRNRIKSLGFFKKVEINKRRVPATSGLFRETDETLDAGLDSVPLHQTAGLDEVSEGIGTPGGSISDRTIIDVEVEEQSTGELSFGIGFSSTEGPMGDISVREKNLLGRGQDLRASIRASGKTQQYDFGFTEPYFLDRRLAAGFDLFQIVRDQQRESSFDEERVGMSTRLGYYYTEYLRQKWRYTLKQIDISNIESDASRFIREQEGETLSSVIGQALTFDTRDNRFDPTEGYFVGWGTDFAGLGGDSQYFRTTLRSGYYIPVHKDKWVFGLEGETGVVGGLGEDVRIQDRYFAGGRNFRGFDSAGIGPRDISSDDALGGNQYYIATTELRFPLGLPNELGISGRVFSDMGSLWDVDDSGSDVKDADSLRASVGFGLGWRSPLGPIRLDFAEAIEKQDYDKTEFFQFSFGTRF